MNLFDSPPLLSANQEELICKFNAAFYDAQELNTLNEYIDISDINNTPEIDNNEQFLLENLDESFFNNINDIEADGDRQDHLEEAPQQYQHNYWLQDDYHYRNIEIPDEGFSEEFSEVFSNSIPSELVTPSSDCTGTFDYDDFSENFEQFNQFATNDNQIWDYQDYRFSSAVGNEEKQALPSMNIFKQCNWEFNHFLRHQDNTSLEYHRLSDKVTNLGHLEPLRFQACQDQSEEPQEANLLVTKQNDALLFDEPNLYSNSHHQSTGSSSVKMDDLIDSEMDEMVSYSLQCKWSDCYQVYDSQCHLVKHIEKAHVEVKRGDEFTCFWLDCPRKTKPFNARYKLLIHMRVHSGEKPNKCPFNGCTKAFSRLENLKIHQRSHTGERPYLCQYPTCSKSFSNSSDRAKHQRTHFDTKPYACQIKNCQKKYTDPSSLRKHVKNHTIEEQLQLKSKSSSLEEFSSLSARLSSRLPALASSTSSTTSLTSVTTSTCTASAISAANPRSTHANTTLTLSRSSLTTTIKQEIKVEETQLTATASPLPPKQFYANYEHDYTITRLRSSFDVKQDLKNKLSEKLHRNSQSNVK